MSEDVKELIEDIVEALDTADSQNLESVEKKLLLHFSDYTSDESALVMEALPYETRLRVWKYLPVTKQKDILLEMHADARESLIDGMSSDELVELIGILDAEDLIELWDELPESLGEYALVSLDDKQRKYFDQAFSYHEEQIGRYINFDVLSLPGNSRVSDALRIIRRSSRNAHSPMVYVTDRFGHYTGVVYLHDIIKALPHSPISELLVSLPSIRAESDLMTAAMEVENAETSALPVVNDNNIFLGCITLADAVWIVREESESVLMKTVGMNEDEDLFAPVKRSAKRRAVWLGINLLTAFLASWTIGLFGETLQQVVALAVLMPIVASMGGIAGSQTLTLVIRGIALGQISDANFKALLKKELRVGILNGVIWSVVVAIVAGLWFQNIIIALVIAIAIIINIAAAALSGVVIPVVLDRLKIDPALSGSVILTTVTDVVGFVAFLGTGTLLLIHA